MEQLGHAIKVYMYKFKDLVCEVQLGMNSHSQSHGHNNNLPRDS